MKNILLFVLITFVALGCKKKEEAKTTTGTTYHFIPQWKADTAYAAKGGYIKGDSIITYYSGDTTLALYHGQKLYVFYIDNSYYSYSDSSGGWQNCYIGASEFDTSSVWTTCFITSPHYWSSSISNWKDGPISIQINKMAPHFDTGANNIYLGYQ